MVRSPASARSGGSAGSSTKMNFVARGSMFAAGGTDTGGVGRSSLPEKILACVIDGDLGKLEKVLSESEFEPEMCTQNLGGNTVFRYACRSGSAQLVQMLVDYGVDISMDVQAFFVAASWGNLSALRTLINRKADVNLLGAGNATPILAAVKNSRLNCCQELISSDADVNAVDCKNNSPLSIALSNNDLEMVTLLVKHGAKVSLERWIHAPQSGFNMCLHLVDGVIGSMEINGPNFQMPNLPAFIFKDWIRVAPSGAALILDKIVISEIKGQGVPQRGELKGNLNAVISGEHEFTQRKPEFNMLCPKDTGRGVGVLIKVIRVPGLVHDALLMSIYESDQPQKLFTGGVALSGIVTAVWEQFVKKTYYFDMAFETCNMITFFMWTAFISRGFSSPLYQSSKLVSLAFLSVVIVRETMSEIGCYFFEKEHVRRRKLQSLAKIINIGVIDIMFCIILICMSAFESKEVIDTYNWNNLPDYLVTLSFVCFLRWIRMIDYMCSFYVVGIKILPVIRSLRSIGAFAGVFLFCLAALLHGTYIFYFSDVRFLSFIDFFVRQYFLGMVSRWPIFMEPVERKGAYMLAAKVPSGDVLPITEVGEVDLDNPFNALLNSDGYLKKTYTEATVKQVRREVSDVKYRENNVYFKQINFGIENDENYYPIVLLWYLLAAILISIVLLQIFVGVLSTAYANEKKRAMVAFASKQSEACYKYMLNRRTSRDSRGRTPKNPVNIFRFLIGRVPYPAENGYLWTCQKSENLTESADDFVETSKKKEYVFGYICKTIAEFTAERTDKMRLLVASLEKSETKLDMLISRNDFRARERAAIAYKKSDKSKVVLSADLTPNERARDDNSFRGSTVADAEHRDNSGIIPSSLLTQRRGSFVGMKQQNENQRGSFFGELPGRRASVSVSGGRNPETPRRRQSFSQAQSPNPKTSTDSR